MKEESRAKKPDTMVKFQLMPGTYYIIRSMEYEDIPQVVQIDREAFPGEWVFRSQAAYKQDLDNPSVRYIVACKKRDVSASGGQAMQKVPWFKWLFSYGRHLNTSEDIVGFSGFWMMMQEAHIIAIGVRNGYRQLGIGEGLLIATIELAQILNANVVTLEVRASNMVAQELYRKYGFQVVGRRLKYYSSDGEDAIIMSTDNITSMPFQASFQQLKKDHAQRHREIFAQVR
jgi:ribosomal-protein-alanine N-acetyltransferase